MISFLTLIGSSTWISYDDSLTWTLFSNVIWKMFSHCASSTSWIGCGVSNDFLIVPEIAVWTGSGIDWPTCACSDSWFDFCSGSCCDSDSCPWPCRRFGSLPPLLCPDIFSWPYYTWISTIFIKHSKDAQDLGTSKGCGSVFIFCGSGSSCSSQCGSGSSSLINADPDPA